MFGMKLGLNLHYFSDHGDLSRTIDQDERGMRFTFRPSECITTVSSTVQMEFDKVMNLSVGGDGIIGRRISIFQDISMKALLAEGVIGWN
jgi:hypothetical protein